MKIIHWIGIDDHADKWTIAHLRGSEEKPSKEFDLIPNEAGYRKLLAFVKALGSTVRIVYEAGPAGTICTAGSTRPACDAMWRLPHSFRTSRGSVSRPTGAMR